MMKRYYIYVIVVIISFFIYSCKKSNNIGYNLLPDEEIVNLEVIDTVSINVYTYSMDSIVSNHTSNFLLGTYDDPYFGRTKSSFAAQFVYQGIVKYETGDVADAIYLKLIYGTDETDDDYVNMYGDPGIPQQIEIYELTESLIYDTSYYSSVLPASLHNNNLLGVFDYIPSVARDDTLMIELDKSFADRFIAAHDTTYSNYSNFISLLFKGLYLTTTTNGLISKFAAVDKTMLWLHYHNIDEPTVPLIDTFSINTNRINLFEHDYSSTSFFGNLNNETAIQDSVAYLQAMGGLKVKITFPFIEELKKLGRIAIVRAELVVKTAPEIYTQEALYPAIQELNLFRNLADTASSYLNEYLYRPDANTTIYYNIDLADGMYRFDIADYLRNVLNQDIENDGLILFPSNGKDDFARSVITTGKHSDRMKLEITYRKLD